MILIFLMCMCQYSVSPSWPFCWCRDKGAICVQYYRLWADSAGETTSILQREQTDTPTPFFVFLFVFPLCGFVVLWDHVVYGMQEWARVSGAI